MALFRSGSGSGLKEVVLWTNPSPTADQSATAVTLSQNYTDFDYVGIYFKLSKSETAEYMYAVSKELFGQPSSTVTSAAGSYSGSYQYVRNVTGTAPTTASIGNAWQVGGTAQSAGQSIITKITGLK